MPSRIPPKFRKEVLALHPACQKCGRTDDLEIHHIVPLIKGGENVMENVMVLCSKCHRELHKGNRSELIKLGMQKVRQKNEEFKEHPERFTQEWWIDANALLNWIHANAEPGFKAIDIVDHILEMPMKINIKKKSGWR